MKNNVEFMIPNITYAMQCLQIVMKVPKIEKANQFATVQMELVLIEKTF